MVTCTNSKENAASLKNTFGPWLVGLSGLSADQGTKGLPVGFPVRVHAWVVGQVPSRGYVRGIHTLMFLSLSFSLPSPLSKSLKRQYSVALYNRDLSPWISHAGWGWGYGVISKEEILAVNPE